MPITFDLHENFYGDRARVVSNKTCISGNIQLFPQPLSRGEFMRKNELLAGYHATALERIGILKGEYILFANGLILLDRNGRFIIIGTTSDDLAFKAIYDFVNTIKTESKTNLLNEWDNLPVAHNCAIASDRYSNNYFHFSLEFIPRFRFYERYGLDLIVIPKSHLEKNVLRGLSLKAIGDRKTVALSEHIRVVDPVLAFSRMTEEGIRWLRKRMNFSVSNGSKRYYIRRGSSMSRIGGSGGLVEDANLEKFLTHFGFQSVEFGNGDLSIEEQIALLDGAQIIFSAHGAHLTNIVYLNPPLTIIEILGPLMSSIDYLSIANLLSFDYYGIASHLVDNDGNIIVDYAKLYEVMRVVLE